MKTYKYILTTALFMSLAAFPSTGFADQILASCCFNYKNSKIYTPMAADTLCYNAIFSCRNSVASQPNGSCKVLVSKDAPILVTIYSLPGCKGTKTEPTQSPLALPEKSRN